LSAAGAEGQGPRRLVAAGMGEWVTFAAATRADAIPEDVGSSCGGLDKPFGTDELLDKIDEPTRSTFPAMPAVLRRLVEHPQGLAGTPWRECVANMTGK
jgi:hypothetical protein